MGLVDRERIKLITLQGKIGPALEQVDNEFRRIAEGDSPLTREICDHIRQGKSKRFRPTLLLLAAQDGDGFAPDAITAAASVELVHTATLVHDDFIDESLTRRGLPTVNVKYGPSAALIMGDYLYSKALHNLCEAKLHHAVELLARTTVLMSEAEMLQLEYRYDMGISEEMYMQVIYQKTASLIENSCRIGVSFNKRMAAAEEAFGTFGSQTGLVFQITDDIFDYLGDERRLGKPTGQDWEEGRITLPLIAAWRNASSETKRRIGELARQTDSSTRAECWPEVKAFVTDFGGVDYAFDKAREFGEKAKDALGPVASGPQKDLLAVSVEYVINRLN
ncbi:MAG: polyprenyl synthetase family protein [Candidatus Krumholzibacteria bacterium]|nr:polyprenyl synthetase family protein [Candidatus Krumholzibacteria bacterium]